MDGLRLYNTLTRRKDPLVPLAVNPETGKPLVRMYVCGPTVYDFAHIGNARPVIVFDVLFRLLRHLYGTENVVYTRNITDVDDKINDRAARDYPDLPLNEAIRRVTEATNAQFQADVSALGCLEPTHQPRATEHIGEMKALIERLVERGFAYVAEGHVLFSPEAMNRIANSSEVGTGSREEFASKKETGRLPRYGALANRSLDEMIAGARVDVAPYKRDATDFVLWKPSADNEPGWPSPCAIPGNGRPGWHIECSAMAMAKLLEPYGGGLKPGTSELACDDPEKNTFDIHGGGIDLVFPHHENEIAQSCCALGSGKMANIWMHNGFLQVEGQKMSKSLGNFVTINELLATEKFGGRAWPGEVLRLAMLKTHYRQPIDFSIARLLEAESLLNRYYKAYETYGHVQPGGDITRLTTALENDLDTHSALTEFNRYGNNAFGVTGISDEVAGEVNPPLGAGAVSRMLSAGRLLGLLQLTPDEWKSLHKIEIDELAIASLITARLAARTAKNFAESDRLRDELVAMGIQIMDSKDPITGELKTTWEVKR